MKAENAKAKQSANSKREPLNTMVDSAQRIDTIREMHNQSNGEDLYEICIQVKFLLCSVMKKDTALLPLVNNGLCTLLFDVATDSFDEDLIGMLCSIMREVLTSNRLGYEVEGPLGHSTLKEIEELMNNVSNCDREEREDRAWDQLNLLYDDIEKHIEKHNS